MSPFQSKRRMALIVEDDIDLRVLTKTILEESELEIIECESAEAALATMLLRGRDVAMVFADRVDKESLFPIVRLPFASRRTPTPSSHPTGICQTAVQSATV